MSDISVIKLPSGSEYNIKDAWARQAIEGLGNPTHFLGESTTAITDGGTQKPTIGGNVVNPNGGDIVVYSNGEFIWSGTAWIELGDLSGLGSLAYKNSASGSVTPTSVDILDTGMKYSIPLKNANDYYQANLKIVNNLLI